MALPIRPLPRTQELREIEEWRRSLFKALTSDAAILLSRIDASAITEGSVLFVNADGEIVEDAINLTFTDDTDLLTVGNIDILGSLDVGGLTSLGAIQFDLTDTTTMQEGLLRWNDDEGTLNLGMPGGEVVLQIGQEHLIRCRNETGAQIDNGSLIYINGASGNKPTIVLADATDENTSASTIGMTTENILHNSNGYVTTDGLVRDIDTDGLGEGSILWLSENPGEYTTSKPAAPAHAVFIGYVIRDHATEGSVHCHISNGFEMYELHDVDDAFSNPGDNNLLQWDDAAAGSGGQLWKAMDIAAIGDTWTWTGGGIVLQDGVPLQLGTTNADDTLLQFDGGNTTLDLLLRANDFNIQTTGSLNALWIDGTTGHVGVGVEPHINRQLNLNSSATVGIQADMLSVVKTQSVNALVGNLLMKDFPAAGGHISKNYNGLLFAVQVEDPLCNNTGENTGAKVSHKLTADGINVTRAWSTFLGYHHAFTFGLVAGASTIFNTTIVHGYESTGLEAASLLNVWDSATLNITNLRHYHVTNTGSSSWNSSTGSGGVQDGFVNITNQTGLYIDALTSGTTSDGAGGTSPSITNNYGIFIKKASGGSGDNMAIALDGDGAGSDIVFGAAQDSSIYNENSGADFDGLVLAPITDPRVVIGTAVAGVDYELYFHGETTSGRIAWDEDLDFFLMYDDINMRGKKIFYSHDGVDEGIYIWSSADGQLDIVSDTILNINAPHTYFGDGQFPVIDSASGNGIKVDTTTPTFGFRDLIGDIKTRPAAGGGASAQPDFVAYRGTIYGYRFGTNAPNAHIHEAFIEFHVPHDYVPGTDMFIHVHWSQIVVDDVGGGVPGVSEWFFDITYADGYGIAGGAADPFITPFTQTITQQGSTTQYGHMIAEVAFTNDGGDGTHLDRGAVEVDGLILVRIYRTPDAGNDTLTEDTFVHYVDLHYQSTNMATKDKNTPFYA